MFRGVAEVLTAFVSISQPLEEETDEAMTAAFEDLEVGLGGIGEVIGWDAAADGVQLHVLADEPKRVIALMIGTLRTLDVQPPTRLVASDPASGATLYERSLI
jgi:hypothetical protein